MPNETQGFLEEFNTDNLGQDILDIPLEQEPQVPKEEVVEESNEESELKPRTRRERRLLSRAESERQSSIQLAETVKTLNEKIEKFTEAKAAADDEDYLKGIERIYGTDSPEAQMATELLRKAIVGARDDAETRAYERMIRDREEAQSAVAKAEEQLDTILDEIQDEYNIEFTEAQETAYFALLQKMSPKDKDGNVTSLADPHAVYEVFSERMQKHGSDNRAKQLSARSMTQSGAAKESTYQDDAHARFLRENDLI